ncbi:type VI secretion system protein ImpA [Nitrospirillum amazonense]|uniref:Type VI secretion system protein ImpA n=1 Tax=Nitrospirillum amazonense TaxID=28077 RepID=A0A560EUT8_9PROT|nr:type VI secretion system protein TssA [Nitrospirillum amazonense]TWB13098.1 type VI secretion system protein ImpA [Nitrospirillum amazonense]
MMDNGVIVSPGVLDLPALLAPIPGDQPCGPDLRVHNGGDATYFQLKDLRATARAIERRADSEDEAQTSLAEWQRIQDLARGVLAQRTKDIEVAVWLTEAAVRLEGFAGLADGFRLLAGLVEQYWDGVHPQPDEDGIAVRLAPIGGLNGHGAEGTLIQPIRKVPLLREDQPIAYWHYALAQRASQTPDTRSRPGRTPPPTLDALSQRMSQVPATRNRALLADIRACRQAFRDLDRLLTERAGADAPPTSTITHILEEVEDAVVFLTGLSAKEEVEEAAVPDVILHSATGAPVVDEAAAPLRPAKGITSREEALTLLAEIGQYFRRTEPHSPLSYTIEDLVRRGRMPLPELLAELLADAGARNTLLTTAGIRPVQGNGQ